MAVSSSQRTKVREGTITFCLALIEWNRLQNYRECTFSVIPVVRAGKAPSLVVHCSASCGKKNDIWYLKPSQRRRSNINKSFAPQDSVSICSAAACCALKFDAHAPVGSFKPWLCILEKEGNIVIYSISSLSGVMLSFLQFAVPVYCAPNFRGFISTLAALYLPHLTVNEHYKHCRCENQEKSNHL